MQKGTQCDPSHRFQKLPDLISARSRVIQFKGYDTVTGIEVTWHEIDISPLSAEQKQNLIETANTLKCLKCDTLLCVIHHWMRDDQKIFFMITESLSSNSVLDQIEQDGPHVMKRAIARWFYSVLQGLSYLHTRSPPIVHNRVSLSSVFVKAATGHVKLIPPLIDPFYLNIDDNSLKLRWSTPPEFLQKNLVPQSDVWLFGLSLLHAVTQEIPYRECKTPLELINKLQSFEPPENINKVDDPFLLNLIRQCFLPTGQRPSSSQLLSHPFFLQDFNEEKAMCHRQNTSGLEVIFSGKSTSSHPELPKLDSEMVMKTPSQVVRPGNI